MCEAIISYACNGTCGLLSREASTRGRDYGADKSDSNKYSAWGIGMLNLFYY